MKLATYVVAVIAIAFIVFPAMLRLLSVYMVWLFNV